MWIATCTPDSSATDRHASIAAGVVPQSSCSLNPPAPATSCSRSASGRTVFPLPSNRTLTGWPSIACSIRARFHGPGVTVVAFVPSDGPVPPPTSVVRPEASAVSTSCGQMKWTWQSTPPAVRIFPLPDRTSVAGPITRAGSTPSMVSGLPALPMPTIRPSRTPMSALTTPQWSSTTVPVMTRSGAPSARVAMPWPIDSRITLPPPKEHLVAGARAHAAVLGDLDEQVGVGKPDPVAGRRPEQLGVALTVDAGHSASFRSPGTTPRPASGTRSTSRSTPGSKRTEVRRGCPGGDRARPPGRIRAPGSSPRSGSGSRPAPDGHRCWSPAPARVDDPGSTARVIPPG